MSMFSASPAARALTRCAGSWIWPSGLSLRRVEAAMNEVTKWQTECSISVTVWVRQHRFMPDIRQWKSAFLSRPAIRYREGGGLLTAAGFALEFIAAHTWTHLFTSLRRAPPSIRLIFDIVWAKLSWSIWMLRP